MEQERYQQQYKAFVQQAEQRLNELCDVYLLSLIHICPNPKRST